MKHLPKVKFTLDFTSLFIIKVYIQKGIVEMISFSFSSGKLCDKFSICLQLTKCKKDTPKFYTFNMSKAF